jgi:hypothetical protein
MLPEHELEELWFGETVICTYWYSFRFTLGTPQCSNYVNVRGRTRRARKATGVADKPVRYCRNRYSIFIEPHLKSSKRYFQLRIALHQFPMDLGFGVGAKGEQSAELSYTLKTSEDKKEIISFSDLVAFTSNADQPLIVYFDLTSSS